MFWPKHDNAHARKRHQRTYHVPYRWSDAIDSPKPENRNENVDASIRGVGTPCSCRVESEQPREQCEARGSGYEQPGPPALIEPEIRQVAAYNFGNSRS